jgi:hypothetical protein
MQKKHFHALGIDIPLIAMFAMLAIAAVQAAVAGEQSPATLRVEARDGSRDFDFEFGEWQAHIARRVNPLTGSNEWVEHEGLSVVRKVWDGRANLGELNVSGPSGSIQGLSLRTYNPETGQWHIHWANSRNGEVGPAMVGGFKDGIGLFYNQERFNGQYIFVRFIFSDITEDSFRLEQAFSPDGGKRWEANWIATFERK